MKLPAPLPLIKLLIFGFLWAACFLHGTMWCKAIAVWKRFCLWNRWLDFSFHQEFSGTEVTSRMIYHSGTHDYHIRMIWFCIILFTIWTNLLTCYCSGDSEEYSWYVGVCKFSKVVWKLLQAHVMTKVSFLDQISRPLGRLQSSRLYRLRSLVPLGTTSVSTVAVTFDKHWAFEMASFLAFVAYYP